MENNSEAFKTRLSSIVLIKQEQTLIFNDQLKIVYKHAKAFRLIWILCESLKEDKYRKLKGISPDDLAKRFSAEGFRMKKEDISTLWHDEILFKRHHENIFSLFDVRDVKNQKVW